MTPATLEYICMLCCKCAWAVLLAAAAALLEVGVEEGVLLLFSTLLKAVVSELDEVAAAVDEVG